MINATNINDSNNNNETTRGGGTLSIMTYNVYMNGYADEEKGPLTVQAILESGHDVVCLQESNKGWQDLLQEQSVYPYTYFRHDQGPYGGRAVLSKYPFTAEPQWLDRVFDWWYGALHATLQVNDTTVVSVLSLHLRAPFPSNPFLVQQQRRQEIETHWNGLLFPTTTSSSANKEQTDASEGKACPPHRIIVLGDFNTREGPCHGFLRRQGLRNALLSSKKKRHAWFLQTWHYGMVGMLFDHIYYNPALMELVDADIPKVGGSDHWPVIAKFEIL